MKHVMFLFLLVVLVVGSGCETFKKIHVADELVWTTENIKEIAEDHGPQPGELIDEWNNQAAKMDWLQGENVISTCVGVIGDTSALNTLNSTVKTASKSSGDSGMWDMMVDMAHEGFKTGSEVIKEFWPDW